MNNEPDFKAKGKAVLNDFVTLAKDTGAFMVALSRHIVSAIEAAVEKNSKKAEKLQAE